MKKYVIQLIEIQEETKKKTTTTTTMHFETFSESRRKWWRTRWIIGRSKNDELLREEKTTNYWKKEKKNSIKVFIENVRISLVFTEITSDVMRIKKKITQFYLASDKFIGSVDRQKSMYNRSIQFFDIFFYAIHIYL